MVAQLVKAGDMDSWDAIPYDFKGLERLLGYIHDHAPEKLGVLFGKLRDGVKERVRAALMAMNRLLPGGEGLEGLRFRIVAMAFGGEGAVVGYFSDDDDSEEEEEPSSPDDIVEDGDDEDNWTTDEDSDDYPW